MPIVKAMTGHEADPPAGEADATAATPPDVHHDCRCESYCDGRIRHGLTVAIPGELPVLGPGAARALLRILLKASVRRSAQP